MLSPRLAASLSGLLAAGCLGSPVDPDTSATSVSASMDPAPLYASHRDDDDAFFCPWHPFTPQFGHFLRFVLSRNPYDRSQTPVLPVVANDGSELAGVEHSSRITWVGHATMAIHDGADVVLTDPVFSSSLFLLHRKTPPGLPIESVPDNAFAVISHSHYDHLDEDSVEGLPASMHWFVPLGLGDWFRERGRSNVVELDWWQSVKYGRWTLTCLPSQHWSRRVGQSTNQTLWCSWLMDSGQTRYFFAGDTGYFPGFREYARRFGPIDVAMLPIGAYAPRWFMGEQHMDPAQAYRAFGDLGARYMIPMHWGTFDLAQEPVDQPPKELRSAIEAEHGDPLRVKILAIGESWLVPPAASAPREASSDASSAASSKENLDP